MPSMIIPALMFPNSSLFSFFSLSLSLSRVKKDLFLLFILFMRLKKKTEMDGQTYILSPIEY